MNNLRNNLRKNLRTYRHNLLTTGLLALALTTQAVQADGSFIALLGGTTESADMDSSGTSWRLLFGPRATDNLSFEMGLMDLGEARNTISGANNSGISRFHPQGGLFSLSYRFGVLEQLDLFVKGGFNLWYADFDRVSIDASNVRTEEQDSVSGVSMITGAGLMWWVLPDLAVRAELETTELESREFPNTRFQLLTLGVQYDF